LTEMLPAVALQFTAVFAEFSTVALNCWAAEAPKVTLAGETLTVTGGGGVCTVTIAVPFDDGATELAAVTVTVGGFGTAAGAV